MSHAERRKITYLRPTEQTSVLILHRVVMSVSDRKARSRAIPVFSGLILPLPASDTPILPSGADALNVLRARHSSASMSVPRSVVPNLFRKNVLNKGRNAPLHIMRKQGSGGLCWLSGEGEYI